MACPLITLTTDFGTSDPYVGIMRGVILALNPQVLNPSKPAAVFDPTQFFNSGDIGVFGGTGASWALTFDEPGIYEYFCAIHAELGMEGTITVVSR